MMKNSEIAAYLLQALNMALQIQGETSYTNSFDVQVADEGFYFVPRLPASYIVGDELYQKIYLISNAALYPDFTLLKQAGAYFVPLNTVDIHVKRALFFPWKKGISERLVVEDISTFVNRLPINTIPIMKNLKINMDKITSFGIAGNSGSGKSYFLTYLLCTINRSSKIIIIDPNLTYLVDGDEKIMCPLLLLMLVGVKVTLYQK
ncbi:FtsK/SpoIIIE family [Enterococcus faecalis AZ19]|nr:FtsK/SpoIIIE family [Enterococcus faecalis AZ19]